MDPFAVEVSNGETAAVVFAAGDALGDALVRPGRVVVHLVFGQDGAQMALPEDQRAVEELTARNVHAFYTARLAQHMGARLALALPAPAC